VGGLEQVGEERHRRLAQPPLQRRELPELEQAHAQPDAPRRALDDVPGHQLGEQPVRGGLGDPRAAGQLRQRELDVARPERGEQCHRAAEHRVRRRVVPVVGTDAAIVSAPGLRGSTRRSSGRWPARRSTCATTSTPRTSR
jgi:hypothetical protein